MLATLSAVILLSGVLLFIVLNFLHLASAVAVILNFLVTSILMVLSLGLLYARDYRRSHA